jgi:hypothetical protein
VSACSTTGGPVGELSTVDTAQGSSENISSLSSVIDRNPRDPDAYNVRGSPTGVAATLSRGAQRLQHGDPAEAGLSTRPIPTGR